MVTSELRVKVSQPAYLPRGAKLFKGNYFDAMQTLLAEGLEPIGPAQVMDIRNQCPTADEDGPWRTWFDTDMGCAWGDFYYLFPHCELLRRMTPETRYITYGFLLAGIDKQRAKQFDWRKVATNKLEEALTNPLWIELARKDGESDETARKRLEQYVQNVAHFRIYDMGLEIAGDLVTQFVLAMMCPNYDYERTFKWDRPNGRGYPGSSMTRLVGLPKSNSFIPEKLAA